MAFNIEGALRLKEMKVLQIMEIDRKLRDAKEEVEQGERIDTYQFRAWQKRARLAKDFLIKEVRQINLEIRIENSQRNGVVLTEKGSARNQHKAQVSAKRYLMNLERSELLKECRVIIDRNKECYDCEVEDLLQRINVHMDEADRISASMSPEKLDIITAEACAIEKPENVFLECL